MPPHALETSLRIHLDSHTPCEFGKYDSEPFATVGDATYWYTRAVYWKRQCDRTAGQQHSLSFVEPNEKPAQGEINLAHVKYLLTGGKNPGEYGNKIAAIKYVRDVTHWGLKESKDWVDNFNVMVPAPWTGPGAEKS